MKIRIAESTDDIAACYPVMKQLRKDLTETQFVHKVRHLQKSGYMLAYLEASGNIVSVAGFRLGESLSWKRYLYVDDLVTSSGERSKGHGSALLDWLTRFALKAGCETLHLDSGVERERAHLFYKREGLTLPAYHFSKHVGTQQTNHKT